MLNDFYITLENGYQWFVAPTSTRVFHISCFKNKFLTTNFEVTSNSILSVRSDCIVANGVTTFTPEKSSNFSVLDHLNFSTVIDIKEIPENVLPKIHIDPVDTKNLFIQGIKLGELDKKLIALEKEKRYRTHWQMGLDFLNTLGYLCIFGLFVYMIVSLSRIGCIQSTCKILCCKCLRINNNKSTAIT